MPAFFPINILPVTMFANYLKIALRNLQRHRGYTLINILGFSIGIACCLFIVLYVQSELLFDRYHQHADDIYRVIEIRNDENSKEAFTSPRMGPTLVADLPEVIDSARMWSGWRLTVKQGQEGIIMRNYYFADPGLMRIFDAEVVSGDPQAALERPNGVVLTESVARMLFGDQDPIGLPLDVEAEDFPEFAEGGFEVGAVIKDLPQNTHLDYDMLLSLATLDRFDFMVESLGRWNSSFMSTYVLATPNQDLDALNEKVAAVNQTYRSPEVAEAREAYLQRLADVHFFSADIQFENNRSEGQLRYVYLFAVIAIVILLIACFNYVNMSTAQSVRRAREVGLRKVSGARRGQLIGQYLMESFLTVAIAMGLAILFTTLMLPWFNTLVGTSLELNLSFNKEIGISVLLLTLVVGIAAGGYPAFFLSGYQLSSVLKGHVELKAVRLRKILVVTQFALSIIMIAATGVIQKQLSFMQTKDLGYNPEDLVLIDINHDDIQTNFLTVKSELMRNASIKNVTVSSRVPADWKSFRQIDVGVPGDLEADLKPSYFNGVDEDFIYAYQINLVRGRNFDRALSTDSTALIINQTAAKALFPDEDALGKPVIVPNNEFEGRVIGVVEDFHIHSLHRQVEPLVMGFMPAGGRHQVHGIDYFTIRLEGGDRQETMAFIEEVHARFDPINPIESAFMADWLADLYTEDNRTGRVFGIGAGLAILIACIGMMGLAAFMAEQRSKEIGVRKVLGASVRNIVALLTNEFLKLVGIAFLIAFPIAYIGVSEWLEGYAYQVSIGVGLFILVALLVAGIACLTVIFQSIRAASTNPVNVLKY